jgi:hypothetical protein
MECPSYPRVDKAGLLTKEDIEGSSWRCLAYRFSWLVLFAAQQALGRR